jgi:histidinol phosphatase-like PHP family hydrolase
MEVPAIARECQRLGMTSFGIADHLNSLDRLDRHLPIRNDIEALGNDLGIAVYFGVELNFLGCDQGFPYSEEVRDRLGFQYAIGGIHGTYLKAYDIRELVDIQHRHHLKTCQDPLIDVLVHPYWFGKGEFDRNHWPWFDTMTVVPESYARELAQVSRDTGTAIEINGCANLDCPAFSQDYVRQYFDYLSILAAEGACFAFASDAHDIGRLRSIERVWDFAERLGIPESRIWRPDGPPLKGTRT